MRHNSKKNPQNDIIAAEFILAPISEWLGHLVGLDDLDGCTPEICRQLLDNQEFKSWCSAVVEALREERCINCVLHMDEKVQHVHCVCSVKMKRESKAKSEKSKRRSKKSEFVLSYSYYYGTRGEDFKLATAKGEKRKALEQKYGRKYDSTQTPLGQLQTLLWEKVGQPYGMERGEAASETGKKGISVKEWRIQNEKNKIDQEVCKKINEYRSLKDKNFEVEKSNREIYKQKLKKSKLIFLSQDKKRN